MKTDGIWNGIVSLFFIVFATLIGCKEEEMVSTPPVAIFKVEPNVGDTNTIFYFDASGSYDNEEPATALKVSWDWENDGIWDIPYTTKKNEEHRYESEGNYIVKLRVTDSNELEGSIMTTVYVSDNEAGEPCPEIPTITYEGQIYNTVQIGNQCWFKENLNVGTMINVSANQTNNNQIEKYCYNNDIKNCDVYGGLYQWDEMMQYSFWKFICPEGWHVPINAEWTSLNEFLGGWSVAGGKMKEKGTTYWHSPNTGATNISGFTALPGGYFSNYYAFCDMHYTGRFWSSTEFNTVIKNSEDMTSEYASANCIPGASWLDGISVRCLKD